MGPLQGYFKMQYMCFSHILKGEEWSLEIAITRFLFKLVMIFAAQSCVFSSDLMLSRKHLRISAQAACVERCCLHCVLVPLQSHPSGIDAMPFCLGIRNQKYRRPNWRMAAWETGLLPLRKTSVLSIYVPSWWYWNQTWILTSKQCTVFTAVSCSISLVQSLCKE